MILSPEYLAEQKDVIERCQLGAKNWRKTLIVRKRHEDLKAFCKGSKKVLSVGSAGLEPIELGATHAIDVHRIADDYLSKGGWKGIFKVASCDNIPAPYKYFDVAVCQEVIEHLPSLNIVRDTFFEINRVAKRWIVTTPTELGDEPTHKRAFNFKMLVDVTTGVKCKIEKRGRYWYVFHDSP